MSLIWGLQLCALLGSAVTSLVIPEQLLPPLQHTTSKVEHRPAAELACDSPSPPSSSAVALSVITSIIRELAPFLLTLGLFTLQAAMREDERVRRQLAAVFGAFGLASCLAFWRVPYVRWPLIAFTACNVLYRALPLPREARRLSGMADTRPPELWVIWLIQGSGFLAAALFSFAMTFVQDRSIAWVLNCPFRDLSEVDRMLALYPRLAWPFFLAMALFSFQGMKASRQWNWRTYSRIFCIMYGAWFLVLLFIWDGGLFNSLLLLPWIAILAFAGLNAVYGLKTDLWFAEEVGEGPDGWVFSDLAIGLLLLFQTILSRRRPHYVRGVAATGSFKPLTLAEPKPPPLDFFHGGVRPQFDVVARFSTSGPDDAGLAPRGVALRLVNWKQERFDLLLSTGAFMGPENLVEFSIAHLARSLGTSAENWLLRRWRKLHEGAVAELRRAPSCYTHLEYHSQTVRFWISNQGVRYLVRYRLVPAMDEPRSGHEGLAPGEDLLDRKRWENEWRSPDYLKQVLKRRIEGGPLKMRLEAQFHSPGEGEPDSAHWFNPGVDWSTRTHPWRLLGEVVLEQALPDTEAEALCFNPAAAPPSLGIPVSPHPLDPRSIADAEKRVHLRVQSARLWLATILGIPKLDSPLQEHQ